MPLEEKYWFVRLFCSVKGEIRPKHRYLHCFLANAQQTLCFAMFYQQGPFNVPQIPRFSSFFTFSSQSKPAKNTGIYSFDKTTGKKTRRFETIFHNFSARAPPFKKTIIFYSIFATGHPNSRRC